MAKAADDFPGSTDHGGRLRGENCPLTGAISGPSSWEKDKKVSTGDIVKDGTGQK